MHLLVLSAFRHGPAPDATAPGSCLNAPFGAQCFPTPYESTLRLGNLFVSMHLLVLSAFRRDHLVELAGLFPLSQCTFWCSVLSDELGRNRRRFGLPGLNAPFGAQCFPTSASVKPKRSSYVSMHLLVLSAFRP